MLYRPADGLRDLVEEYDLFLVDQFGVLHDGRRAFPGAVEALRALKAAGKRVLLLSNSGRRAPANLARLARLGIPAEVHEGIVTSGETAWHLLEAGAFPFAPRGAACHLIRRGQDGDIVEGLGFRMVERPEAADFILLAGVEPETVTEESYASLLAPAAAREVPLICSNPDLLMYTEGGVRFGAGQVALDYAKAGGPVLHVGKPHPEIYRFALGDADPVRAIGVGDSPHHDVAGATGAGIAAALVRSGLYPEADAARLPAGTWVLPGFVW